MEVLLLGVDFCLTPHLVSYAIWLVKISVLVTSLNHQDKMRRLLNSLAQQTFRGFELLVIDDGSLPPYDDLRTEASLFIRHDQPQGYIKSRNELAHNAKGEYLLVLDDDVILHNPEFMAAALKRMESDPLCAAMAFPQLTPAGEFSSLQPCPASSLAYSNRFFGWAHMIKRKVWLKLGGLCELFDYGGEEVEFSLRLLDAGYRIIYDPTLAVIHDAESQKKNFNRRIMQAARNGVWTTLMRFPISDIFRPVLGTIRFYAGRPSVLFGILRDTILNSNQWISARKPVSRQTIRLSRRLSSAPYFTPPIYPR